MGKLKEKVTQLQDETAREQEDLLRKCNTCSRIQSRYGHSSVIRNTVGDPKTCLEALTTDPSLESGIFRIDPDGPGRGDDPIYVYCNMSTGISQLY